MSPDKKTFCAACLWCRVFRHSNDGGATYVLKVRCAKRRWKTRAGRDADHDLHTLRRRVVSDCPYFEASGDADDDKEFLRNLFENSLPSQRTIHRKEDG